MRLVSFSIGPDGSFVDISYAQISNPFIDAAEYILRAGWTPDARHVWVQLLNRQQDTLKLVLVSVPLRHADGLSRRTDQLGTSAMETESKHNDLMAEIDFEGVIMNATLLLEEKSSVWINVHDILHFLPNDDCSTSPSTEATATATPTSVEVNDASLMENGVNDDKNNVPNWTQHKDRGDCHSNSNSNNNNNLHRRQRTSSQILEFVWANESTGFRHLYLYRIDLDMAMVIERRPLTSGDWEVSDKYVWVDNQRRLVYFIGLKDSPLEKHL